jgi:hypothetical protein
MFHSVLDSVSPPSICNDLCLTSRVVALRSFDNIDLYQTDVAAGPSVKIKFSVFSRGKIRCETTL